MFEHIRKQSSSKSDLTPTPNQPIAQAKSRAPQRHYTKEEAEKAAKQGFNGAKIPTNERNFSATETNDTISKSPETENTEKEELQLKSETEIIQSKESISDRESEAGQAVTESADSSALEEEASSKEQNKNTMVW